MANKTKYNLRHVRCNMNDFHAERHRFRFEYNEKEYVIPCYGAFDIHFDEIENEIPEDAQLEISNIIFTKFDNGEEKHWRYPQEAYDIANDYYAENFSVNKMNIL